jgi:hypothetical protein
MLEAGGPLMRSEEFSRLMRPLTTGPFRSWTDEECLRAIQLIDEEGLTQVQQAALVTALHILAKPRTR